MPRPAGVRNKDFVAKRDALLNTLTEFALTADLRRPSLRQFAMAAETSEPTLRHYFSDRQGLVVAVLENIGRRGQPLWQTIETPSTDAATAIIEYFRISEAGMRHGGFIRAHAFGLVEGIADPVAGKAYLENVLEPALAAVGNKLKHTPGGPTDEKALRAAGLAAMAPLLVLSLHQDLLGGSDVAEFDTASVFSHLRTWLGAGLSS